MNMRISVRNFRGSSQADIQVSGIALLAGDGGASKSSILQAMAAVTTGNAVPFKGLTKGDAGRLVRSGAEKGEAKWEGDAFEAVVRWPKAQYETTGSVPFVSLHAAGIVDVMDLKEDERAKLLAPLIGSSPTAQDLVQGIKGSDIPLRNNGVGSEEDATEMKPLGLNVMDQRDVAIFRLFKKLWSAIQVDGWDSAQKQAEKTGRELKGGWKQAAGGEAYGSAKAPTWTPAGWDDDLASASVADLQVQVDEATRNRDAAVGQSAVDGANVARLKALAAEADDDVDTLKAAVKKATQSAEDAQAALDALPPASTEGVMGTCPHCAQQVQINAEKANRAVTRYSLVVPQQVSEQEAKSRRDARTDADLKVVAANRVLREAEGALQVGMTRNAVRTTARQQVGSLVEQPDTAADVGQATAALQAATARLGAATVKAEADRIHHQIVTNQAIVDLLAPDGVRRKVLQRALSTLNDGLLADLSKATGWGSVTLNEDLDWEYSGRSYPMLCRSEKRRVSILAQVAVAKLDKSALVLIDDADDLPVKARGGLLNMLAAARIPAVVALMVGSHQKVPDLAASGAGMTYWVDGGRAVPVAALKQAAE